jgi:aspartate racemase
MSNLISTTARGPVGVLGGMGPLATADFFRKLVEATPAHRDQDHVPIIIYSVPEHPNLVDALTNNGPSPLPAILRGLGILKRADVQLIVMPCNTVHSWYSEIQDGIDVPVLHIVDAVRDDLLETPVLPERVGLLATEPTLRARIYQDRLAACGIDFVVNPIAEREEFVLKAIKLVKQGHPNQAGLLLECAIQSLLNVGVQSVILACTELPVALASINSRFLDLCIDPTLALARATVAWSLTRPE